MLAAEGNTKSVRVGIVGAGIGGIAVAAKLKMAGFSDLVVFEKSDGPGGTWHYNTYPGCEVDIPSDVYSYSFCRHNWSRTHAKQPEIKEYLEKVIDQFDLWKIIRFS
ncbi:MAG: NAD(P)-binding protein, partial [Acidimicrobiia bacterium]